MVKSSIHILRLCPTAMDVCGAEIICFYKWSNEVRDVWKQMVIRLTPRQLESSAIILKNLWRKRNEVIFEDNFDHPILIFQKTKTQLKEFSQAQT